MGFLVQATPDLVFMLLQEIVDELFSRIIRDSFCRIHEAESRGRDHGLLYGPVRVALRNVEVAVRLPLVAKGPFRETGHAANVTGAEGNLESIRSGVGKAVDRVRPEVVVLPLLAVGDDRRPGLFEAFDCVFDRRFVKRSESRIFAVSNIFYSINEFRRARDASNRLGWNRHKWKHNFSGQFPDLRIN